MLYDTLEWKSVEMFTLEWKLSPSTSLRNKGERRRNGFGFGIDL